MLTTVNLDNIRQTGDEMRRLAYAFREDMLPYAHLTTPELFDLLASIPYRADPESVEFLQRPYYTMTRTGDGGDCDDKAICVAAYATLRNLPHRFIAVAKNKGDDLHHVFCEILEGENWVTMDVTYAFNSLNEKKQYGERITL